MYIVITISRMGKHVQTYETLWGASLPATQQTSPTSFGSTLNHFVTVGAAGWIVGIKWLQSANVDTLSGIGFLVDNVNGGASVVRAAPFKRPPPWTAPPTSKWQTAYFHPRYPVTAGQTLRFGVVLSATFGWWFTANALSTAAFVSGDLTLPQDTSAQHNGRFAQTATQLILPNTAASADMFGIDILFLKQ